MSDDEAKDLAAYILGWLETRNGAELGQALAEMRVGDRRLLVGELELILKHGGKPPNWTR